ncbi:MAG TPA: FAD-binding oxidoreductase [Candidatus Saccharimonadales bacterium]|nr:FAD-binding oxidoreductase [Candidatus Saccharimonadales bacterium]
MNKVATYLQQHLSGEVVTTPSVRRYFSTDGSVFEMMPQVVIYPKNATDVRKLARFAWQLAEKGHKLPLTARGHGTDQGGAAIGRGMSIVFPAHMDRLLELDASKGFVRVQPGMNYRTLQDILISHRLFLPPYPASIDYCSIGGAVANNAAGEKSVKYGATRRFVKELKVVLGNGDVIETKRLSKRELNRKKGQTDLEGEIYRQLDNLLTDHATLLADLTQRPQTTKNSSGYALTEVKQKDGSFDLTPLFVGAQGTLGFITEATLDVETYNPEQTLLVGQFETLEQASEAIEQLTSLHPSALEIVDKHVLTFLAEHDPAKLKGILEAPFPAFLLLAEFDDASDRTRKKLAKKASKIFGKLAHSWQETSDLDEQERVWDIRHGAATAIWQGEENGAKALPIIEDGIVPQAQFATYVSAVYALFAKHHLQVSLWGHAGDANLHMQPFLDLAKLGDRQKIFKLMDEYYALVASLGGNMSAEHGDGRLRGPYLEEFYGKEIYTLFQQVKAIFDPHNILNPGVKVNSSKAEAMALLRSDYNLAHLSDHLPRS